MDSAGSRDSALTNHGYQQATRLGLHFASLGLTFTHLFSSHLQRAAKTAGWLRYAQAARNSEASAMGPPAVLQLPVLMEQDFGFYEGKKFYERPSNGKQSGKEHHRQAHKDSNGFVDVESKESLAQRADLFLDGHLLPLFDSTERGDLVIAIVSHGIMLSSLWKRLLSRLPERSLKLAPELAATAPVTLEHLGGWSNTGYLELRMSRSAPKPAVPAPSTLTEEVIPNLMTSLPPPAQASSSPESSGFVASEAPIASKCAVDDAQPKEVAKASEARKIDSNWSTVICMINGKDHLKGLKRTGGGVGSSRHDASQKGIESFFKRRKVD